MNLTIAEIDHHLADDGFRNGSTEGGSCSGP